MNSIEVVNSVIVRKLSDGEELIIAGPEGITRATANPRDPALERRSQALAAAVRPGVAVLLRPKGLKRLRG